MQADRRPVPVLVPPAEALSPGDLVARSQAARIRPQREVDPRTDLPDRSPKTKTIPANDADFFSPMG